MTHHHRHESRLSFPVRLLIDNGCSINQSDTKGQTALHLAAGRSQVQLLELLLRHRANVSTVDEQVPTDIPPAHFVEKDQQPKWIDQSNDKRPSM